MPQSSLVNWLFSWKKPKATPRSVWDRFEPTVAERTQTNPMAADAEWIASMRSQFEFDGHRIERLIDRVDELENDAAGKEARIDRLEADLKRLREEAGFA